jgi:hypothetical protein
VKIYWRRKGSQRTSKPTKVEFYPNYSGQDGLKDLILVTDQEYLTLEFESEEEVKQLLSQAHIIHHNYS